jgi:hypothetical protein
MPQAVNGTGKETFPRGPRPNSDLSPACIASRSSATSVFVPLPVSVAPYRRGQSAGADIAELQYSRTLAKERVWRS